MIVIRRSGRVAFEGDLGDTWVEHLELQVMVPLRGLLPHASEPRATVSDRDGQLESRQGRGTRVSKALPIGGAAS